MGRPPKPSIDRYNKYIDVREEDECWFWNSYHNAEGYPIIYSEGKNLRVSRYSYELHIGKIPEGLLVCHTCDNVRCVNPNHLFLGTNNDNMKDKAVKGRSAKGIGHGRCKLSEEDVLFIRNNCRAYDPKLGVKALSETYGISVAQVRRIVLGLQWGHI